MFIWHTAKLCILCMVFFTLTLCLGAFRSLNSVRIVFAELFVLRRVRILRTYRG